MQSAALAAVGAAALLAPAVATAQDAAKVDPKHYKVEFENDRVRVLRISYGPHEKGVMHSHPPSVVIYLNDIHGRFTLPGGKTQDASAKAGSVQWTDATTHQPENIGDKGLEVIQVELKGKPPATK
jgi:polyisoprenoid-binding protein YceI